MHGVLDLFNVQLRADDPKLTSDVECKARGKCRVEGYETTSPCSKQYGPWRRREYRACMFSMVSRPLSGVARRATQQAPHFPSHGRPPPDSSPTSWVAHGPQSSCSATATSRYTDCGSQTILAPLHPPWAPASPAGRAHLTFHLQRRSRAALPNSQTACISKTPTMHPPRHET